MYMYIYTLIPLLHTDIQFVYHLNSCLNNYSPMTVQINQGQPLFWWRKLVGRISCYLSYRLMCPVLSFWLLPFICLLQLAIIYMYLSLLLQGCWTFAHSSNWMSINCVAVWGWGDRGDISHTTNCISFLSCSVVLSLTFCTQLSHSLPSPLSEPN